MAGFKELVLKGAGIADLALAGAANHQGQILVAGADDIYAALAEGTNGQILTSGGANAALSWSAAGTGDFKADGTIAMTAPLRLKANAGEAGMGTVDGSIFFDTTADKVKVYVA